MCKWHVNCDRLIFLSFGYTMLMTGFVTAQGLAAKVLKDNDFGDLGFYSLGVLYFFFGASSFVSAPIVGCLGDKWSLSLGMFTYTFYLSAFIPPCLRSEDPENETL